MQFQQVVHLNYVRFMPIIQILSILSSLVWLYLPRNSTNGIAFALVAMAAVGMIRTFPWVSIPIAASTRSFGPERK